MMLVQFFLFLWAMYVGIGSARHHKVYVACCCFVVAASNLVSIYMRRRAIRADRQARQALADWQARNDRIQFEQSRFWWQSVD